MKPLLTPAQMYALEARHFADGMPTLTAMENAAQAFVREITRRTGSLSGKRIHIACGAGNNAGDGYAIARLAHESGALVSVIAMTPVEKLRGDALVNARRIAGELHLPILPPDALNQLPVPDWWVDALFGIGLNRPLGEEYLPLLNRMQKDRQQGAKVAAVDVPSGLNAGSGVCEGPAVQADLTVTFQYPKTGHCLMDGMDMTGELIISDIGMTQFAPDSPAYLVEPCDPAICFPARRHNSHKGTYGHLLVVAGSFGMAGAAAYTAHAALRSGAGLVTIACPASVVPVLQTVLPAAMCIPLPEKDGAISAEAEPFLLDALHGKSAAVVGPGLSRRADKRAVRTVLESGLPAVIDADGLNLLSMNPELMKLLRPHHVLTPHPGEAVRLCPECGKDPLKACHRLKELGATALYKGPSTVIEGKSVFISASGSPGMAVGGSGDVLSGILGAFIASGIDPQTAAWAASEIHGQCGEKAAQRLTEHAMNASDLIDQLPEVIRCLTSP